MNMSIYLLKKDVCMCVCVYVSTLPKKCVCMCVCVCVYIHISIPTIKARKLAGAGGEGEDLREVVSNVKSLEERRDGACDGALGGGDAHLWVGVCVCE
jgi:hypothetical protein